MKIKKAIITAAGFGTRMLPQTKSIPKEMLPILNKPAIQYVVEELVESGITDIVIVTSRNKDSIEDHFDHSAEMETYLERCGKDEQLKLIRDIPQMAHFTFVRQMEGYGNALPLISAKHLLKDEPFMLLWGDIIADKRRTQRAMAAFEKYQSPVLCAAPKASEMDYRKYGYISGKEINDKTFKVDGMIEKPETADGHLGYAVMNGYLLTPEIFDEIDKLKPNKQGELCVIDAISALAAKQSIYAVKIDDVPQFDIGTIEEYTSTILHKAMEKPELKKLILDITKQYAK